MHAVEDDHGRRVQLALRSVQRARSLLRSNRRFDGKLKSWVVTADVRSRANHGAGCPAAMAQHHGHLQVRLCDGHARPQRTTTATARIAKKVFRIAYVCGLAPGPCIVQRHFEVHLLASAKDGDGDRIACVFRVHRLRQVLRAGDLLAVEGHNQVAAQHHRIVALVSALGASVQAGFFGRAARQHALDQDA